MKFTASVPAVKNQIATILQVYAMPVFDKIESYLVTKRNFTPGKNLRLVARSGYVGMHQNFHCNKIIFTSTK